jgi:hypothetical protein
MLDGSAYTIAHDDNEGGNGVDAELQRNSQGSAK